MNSGVFALLVAFATLSVIYADDHDYYGRYCQRPAYPRYGGIKGQAYDRYDLGSSVYFYCDYGYELVGYASARCSHGPRGTYYWNYEPPVCRPKGNCACALFYNCACALFYNCACALLILCMQLFTVVSFRIQMEGLWI